MENEEFFMLVKDFNKRDSSRNLVLKPNFDEKVALVKFSPGLDSQLIDWYVNNNFKGIVLEGTGLGHVGGYCFSAVKNAIDKGVLVAMTSQCIWGRVNMNVYNQGRDLLAFGVIPLEDMLPETALVKLMWVFGQTSDVDETKRLMLTNIAHEISPRSLHEGIREEKP
jgi:glutamyl-tRNA(Gln) amidotransferase subunit D